MQKLLIIDGCCLLFQMFFGMPSRITGRNGAAIQGTMGFVGGLLKIIKMIVPTHIVAVFDGERASDRRDICDDYKRNRTDYRNVPAVDNPFSQLPDIYIALDFMRIRRFETDGMEADDVIASYAIGLGREMSVVIASSDTDFYQLASENVSLLRYRGKNTVIYDSEKIKEKYGIEACLFADYKALTGDSSDNIRGIKGIGPKTAAELINEFGGVFSIIGMAENIKRLSIKTAILQNTDLLERNYRLIKLNDRANIPFGLDELKFDADMVFPTTQILTQIGLR